MTDRNDTRIVMAEKFRHLDPNQSMAGGIQSGFSRIGYKGKNWSLHHEGEVYLFINKEGLPLQYLDVVFVGANPVVSKMYYEGEYHDDSLDAPICAAVNGEFPDPGVPQPQSKSCGLCKHNEWLPNRGGKECQDHKRTAVLLLPYMKTDPPLDNPVTVPIFLKIPPNSLKTFKAYNDSLSHRGAHFASVITRITFEPNNLFKMTFAMRQPLTNDEADTVLDFMDHPQTRNVIGSIPEIKEVNPVPEERQETGLMAAFGQKSATVTNLPTPKRGRPAKSKTNPEIQETVPKIPEEEVSEQQQDDDTTEESDGDLDTTVKNVLSKRLGDMLK